MTLVMLLSKLTIYVKFNWRNQYQLEEVKLLYQSSHHFSNSIKQLLAKISWECSNRPGDILNAPPAP